MGLLKTTALLCSIFLPSLYNACLCADSIDRYGRSSLYIVLVEHPGLEFDNEIKTEFFNMPFPDKFNNHNLSRRNIVMRRHGNMIEDVETFINSECIGKRLVSKWFDRNKEIGSFDVDLIKERGVYNASVESFDISNKSVRGRSLLEDEGEELIKNTFVLFVDIRYVDKSDVSGVIGSLLTVAGAVAASVSVSKNDYVGANQSLMLGQSVGNAVSLIAGFKVNVRTFLYRLQWSQEDESVFYHNYYYESQNINEEKKRGYESDNKHFKLEYIGDFSSESGKTVLKGVQDNSTLIRKVCVRALDDNIIMLQRKYDVFKIKMPIIYADKDEVHSYIGLKEGVNERNQYEVLDRVITKNTVKYIRKGIVIPIKNKIWDNRYMSLEEQAENSSIGYTSFKIISGSDFYPGMLMREIK